MDSINTERSYTEYEVTEPTTDFAIGFDNYSGEDKDAIHVTLDGVNLDNLDYTVVRKNAQVLEVTPAITSGVVRLQRETYIDQAFHNFTAGALFSPKAMDENFEQVRHSQQEVNDGFTFLADNTLGVVSAAEAATARANAAAELANDFVIGKVYDVGITVTPKYTGELSRPLSDVLEDIINVRSFGAKGDGVSDDTIAIQKALDAAVGRKLHLPKGAYVLTSGSPVVPSDSYITMDAGTVVRQPNKGEASGFIIEPNSKNIRIIGGKIVGAYEGGVPMWQGDKNTALVNGDTYALHMKDNIGIHIRGRFYQRNNLQYTHEQMQQLTDETRNIVICNVEITGFGQSAIIADQVKGSIFNNNNLHRCGRDGLRFYGAVDCIVDGNIIDELSPGVDGQFPNWNVYGVACTRLYGQLPAYPDPDSTIGRPTSRVLMTNNIVSNCHTWKGLDTHGGVDIRFINNHVTNCYIGVGIDSGGSGASGLSPPTNITVLGNTFISNSQARYKRAAITVFGAGANNDGASGEGNGATITGNIFDGYGGDNADGVISISKWRNVSISANTFRNFSRCAIAMADNVSALSITGNTFSDAYCYFTVNVANGGSGYLQTPQVLVNGQLRDSFKVIPKLSGGVVVAADIVYLSNGWVDAPALTVVPTNGGSGCTLVAIKNEPSVVFTGSAENTGLFDGNIVQHDSALWSLRGVSYSAAPLAGKGFKSTGNNIFTGTGQITPLLNAQYDDDGGLGMTPVAMLRVNAAGAIVKKSAKVESVTKLQTGVYEVTLRNIKTTALADIIPSVSILNTSDATSRVAVSAATKLTVHTVTISSNAYKDADWALVIYS